MKKIFFIYLMAVTIPLLLGLVVWQSTRYQKLHRETIRLEQVQAEWVDNNKRMIGGIAEQSSPERIEHIAKNQLNLRKIRPENILQVRIVGGLRHE